MPEVAYIPNPQTIPPTYPLSRGYGIDCPGDCEQDHGTQTFLTPGADTWIAPPTVTSVIAECFGAGGAGAHGTLGAAAGGGGGAYAKKTVTVVPGIMYNLFVGAGGVVNGAAASGTWFVTSGTVFADYGEDGEAGTPDAQGGQASASIGDTKFSGGNGGSEGPASTGGGGGSSAGIASVGTNGANGGIGVPGAGGVAPAGGGDGGKGGIVGTPADPGVVPGGGGGGGDGISLAANGARGKLVLTW